MGVGATGCCNIQIGYIWYNNIAHGTIMAQHVMQYNNIDIKLSYTAQSVRDRYHIHGINKIL